MHLQELSNHIEIDIDECEVTIKELRKLRNKYYDKKDYDTVEKIKEIIDLYENFKEEPKREKTFEEMLEETGN